MEYYALILNRTFLITVGSDAINGAVCRGLTSITSGDPLAQLVTGTLAVHGDLKNPRSYVSDKRLKQTNHANFSIKFSDICSVVHDPSKKWGMGYYPHDGKLLISTSTGTREFIILGAQSGQHICASLNDAVGRANSSFKADGCAAS